MKAMEETVVEGLREAKKMKMTEGGIANPNPTDDGRPNPNRPTGPAQVFKPLCFFWTEYGPMPTAEDLRGLFCSMCKSGLPTGLKLSCIYAVQLDEHALKNFKVMCQDNFLEKSLKIVSENHDDKSGLTSEEEDEEIESDLEVACRNRGVNFWEYDPQDGYSIYPLVICHLFTFAVCHPPPATIVFISSDGDFAHFLGTLKEKGYNIIVIGRSEDASSAFLKAGLVVCDWGPASRGEGFFPIGV